MPIGRPTKYNKELLAKAKEYLFKYEELGDVVPTVEGLSIYLGISRDVIYEWCKDEEKKEFIDTVKQINATQKQVLINKGLDNKFNASITKLLLGANHSVIEKTAQEVSGPDGKPQEHKWTIEFVEATHEK